MPVSPNKNAGSPLATGPGRYTSVAIVLHWCLALVLIAQIGLGFAMDRAGLPDTLAFTVFQIHRALGVLILLLVMMRIGWRFTHRPPAFPVVGNAFAMRLAHGVHGLLYGLQVLAPLSGWALASASTLEIPLSFFGWFDWPLLPIAPTDNHEALFRSLHHIIVWSFAGLIVLHSAAAVYHALVRHDGVLRRMLLS